MLFTISIAPGTLNERALPPPKNTSIAKMNCQLSTKRFFTLTRENTISPGEFKDTSNVSFLVFSRVYLSNQHLRHINTFVSRGQCIYG